jgi:transposase
VAKRRFHDWREWRRFQALRLVRRGWKPRDIAEALGVSEGAVSQWLAQVRDRGPLGLRSRSHTGHPKLRPEQIRLIPDFLWHGAEAYGFRGELWTCGRLVKVIERELGVRYNRHHVSRMLKGLGWTPQIPITRAIQRDEEDIARWRTDVWPELKKRARQERRTLVFTDESGFYLLPSVVRTYGPKGKTPVLQEWQTRDHLSVMGAVTAQGTLHTLIRQKPFNGLHCIAFLQHLLRHVRTDLLVIWDRSPIHRRIAVKEFIAGAGESRLVVEFLPIYAPDLNPVEWLWKHLKGVELCNQPCLDLEELHSELHLAVNRIRPNLALIASFFDGAGLELAEL